MDLPIRVSKKGTRVIKASDLHRALGLSDHQFQANVRVWIKDVYQFADGIRRPVGLQDYARSPKSRDGIVQEYYFNLEMARLVALSTKSKVKQAIATKLSKEEAVYPDEVKLSPEETLELMEQTRAMARISCQEAAEERHLKAYIRQRGSADFWNKYRVDHVVRTTMDELRKYLAKQGLAFTRTHRVRDLMLRKDPIECIRIGIVDHYAAQGYSLPYALEMGRLAKAFAEALRLEVTDDRQGDGLFTAPADLDVVRKLQRAAA